jgi:hypothetical protein
MVIRPIGGATVYITPVILPQSHGARCGGGFGKSSQWQLFRRMDAEYIQ